MGGVRLIRAKKFVDERGWFFETYSVNAFTAAGVDCVFVQDNQSYSRAQGTVRALHYQRPPHAQGKLVRCVRGAILDVAVDLRRGSPTYGGHVSVELTGENGDQLFVPAGFAHGFVTLEPDTEVAYKVTMPYAPSSEGGLLWNDPALGIPWPLPASGAVVSQRDRELPLCSQFESPFDYDGDPLEPL